MEEIVYQSVSKTLFEECKDCPNYVKGRKAVGKSKDKCKLLKNFINPCIFRNVQMERDRKAMEFLLDCMPTGTTTEIESRKYKHTFSDRTL